MKHIDGPTEQCPACVALTRRTSRPSGQGATRELGTRRVGALSEVPGGTSQRAASPRPT